MHNAFIYGACELFHLIILTNIKIINVFRSVYDVIKKVNTILHKLMDIADIIIQVSHLQTAFQAAIRRYFINKVLPCADVEQNEYLHLLISHIRSLLNMIYRPMTIIIIV